MLLGVPTILLVHPTIIRMDQNALLINLKKAKTLSLQSLVPRGFWSSSALVSSPSFAACLLLLLPPRLVALPAFSTVEVSSSYFLSSFIVISDVV